MNAENLNKISDKQSSQRSQSEDTLSRKSKVGVTSLKSVDSDSNRPSQTQTNIKTTEERPKSANQLKGSSFGSRQASAISRNMLKVMADQREEDQIHDNLASEEDDMISYEYCTSTDGDESYSSSDESEIPDKAPVLTPDDVTTMMNNKIDNIKGDI